MIDDTYLEKEQVKSMDVDTKALHRSIFSVIIEKRGGPTYTQFQTELSKDYLKGFNNFCDLLQLQQKFMYFGKLAIRMLNLGGDDGNNTQFIIDGDTDNNNNYNNSNNINDTQHLQNDGGSNNNNNNNGDGINDNGIKTGGTGQQERMCF